MDTRTPLDISRRAFIAGGIGALGSLFLPQIPGTEDSFLMPFYPEEAWADEMGATGTIMVVGRTQVGIAVGDMDTLDPELQRIKAIAGAEVTIRSHYNGAEAYGTTDETGKVVIDIEKLAEKDSGDSPEATDSNGKKLEYCFNGSIRVQREGYRDVYIPRMRIRSVSAIIAPTRVFDREKPYLRQLSFDGWDLQYTRATFMVAKENTETHSIVADAWIPAHKRASLRLYHTVTDERDRLVTTEVGTQTLTGGSYGRYVSATFSEKFLDPSWPKKVLPQGCVLHAALTTDDETIDITAGLDIKEVPFVADPSGTAIVTPSNKFNLDEDLSLFDVPTTFPKPLGGSRLSIWKPSFENVMFDFSPLGYLMLGLKLGSTSLTNDSGSLDKDAWKKSPKQGAGEQFNRLCSEQQKAIDGVGQMMSAVDDSGKTKAINHEISKELKLSGAFKMFAQLQYDWEKTQWIGDLTAAIGGVLNASWTLQATIVVVPVYVSFDLRAALTAGLRLGMRTYGDGLTKLIDNASFNASATNSSVVLSITIGVSLGMGVADVVCAYIRGAGYLTICAAFYQADPELPSPRLTVGLCLEASIGVQFLLFSWYGTIWEQDWPLLYDTNKAGADASTVATLAANGGVPLDKNGMPTFDRMDMRIVTNGELLGTQEFSASDTAVTLSLEDDALDPLAELEPEDLGDDNLLWSVPATIDPNVATYADEPEHFIYLGESGTGASVPSPTDPEPGEIGVAGIADDEQGGIRPSSDTRIFTGVFSDPRIKTINFDGGTFMFRLATVGYGSEARTRLVYSTMGDSSWNEPHVLDFVPTGSGMNRADMYDYDFSVTTVNGMTRYMYLMVVSGVRPDGDDTTFANAFAKTVISLVRIYNSNWGDAPLRTDTAISWVPTKAGTYASFSMPSVVSYVDEKSFDRETNTCVLGTCLVRAARSPEALLKDSASRYIVTFFAEHKPSGNLSVVTNQGKLAYGGVTKLTMGPIAFNDEPQSCVRAAERHAHIALVTSYGSFIEKVVVNCPTDDVSKPGTISLEQVAMMSEGEGVQRLYPTGRDYEFYAIRTDESLFAEAAADGQDTSGRRDGRLYLLSFNAAGKVSYEPVGPKTCVPSELAVSKDGRYLYYVVNREGKARPAFTETGDVDTSQTEAETNYRVMAMARVGGLFTRPFTLCELDHPVDYVVSMTTRGATAALIAATVTDAQSSTSDIYDIRIPLAVCATPTAISTEGMFAFAGEQSVFNVAVRNDGNTILSGATFNLYAEGDDTPADSVEVQFEPDVVTYAEGEEAPEPTYEVDALSDEFAASPLASTGAGGLLAPGDTQTYKVTFSIPEDWAGEGGSGGTSGYKTVRVSLSDLTYVETDATVTAFADDPDSGSDDGIDWAESNSDFDDIDWEEFIKYLLMVLIEYYASLESCPTTEIGILDAGLNACNFESLYNHEVSSNDPDSGDDPGVNPGGSGESAGANSSTGAEKSLPDTGDPGILGMLADGLFR